PNTPARRLQDRRPTSDHFARNEPFAGHGRADAVIFYSREFFFACGLRRGIRMSSPCMTPATPAPDDAALLLAVARRDEVAFASLYDRMSRPVFSLIVSLVPSRAEAEEVMQEAF